MNENEKSLLEFGQQIVEMFCGTELTILTASDVKKILAFAEQVYDERLGNERADLCNHCKHGGYEIEKYRCAEGHDNTNKGCPYFVHMCE